MLSKSARGRKKILTSSTATHSSLALSCALTASRCHQPTTTTTFATSTESFLMPTEHATESRTEFEHTLSKCSQGRQLFKEALLFSGPAASTALSASHRPTTLTTTSTESFLMPTEFAVGDGERKEEEEEEEEEAKGHDIVVDLNMPPSLFVQPELLPKSYWTQTRMIKRRGHLEQHWVVIYAFLDLSFVDRLKMRSYCRLFHEVEKILTLNKHGHEMLKPLPLYASFPCRNFSSLPDLMNELNARFAALPDIVWELCAAPETLSAGMKVRVKTSAVHGAFGQGAFGQGAFGQGGFGGAPASFKDATIQKVNDDETFDVVFDDDDVTKKNVPLNEMQIQNVSVDMLRFLFSFRKTAERVVFCCFYSHCSLLLRLSSLVFLLYLFHIIHRRQAYWQDRKQKQKLSNLS